MNNDTPQYKLWHSQLPVVNTSVYVYIYAYIFCRHVSACYLKLSSEMLVQKNSICLGFDNLNLS